MYCDPQSTRINLQSPQSDSAPWTLTLLKSLIEEQTGINEQGWKKKLTLPAFLLSKLINEQGGTFCLLHEKLQAGWKENLIS